MPRTCRCGAWGLALEGDETWQEPQKEHLCHLIWVDGGEIDKINSLDVQGQAKTLEEDLEVELVPE